MDCFCRVVLRDATRAFDRMYTYRIPPEMEKKVDVGSLVEVPFGKGNRTVEAYVAALMKNPDTDFYIKPLNRVLSERPLLRPDQIRLASEMRERWICTYGEALRCMVPAAVTSVRDKKVRMAELIDPQEAARRLAEGELNRAGQQRVILFLLDVDAAPVQDILSACGVSRSVLNTLARNEWIRFFEQEVRRELDDEPFEPQKPFPPNADQAAAIHCLTDSLKMIRNRQNGYDEYLLFGVTGSGKTEVYLQTAQAAVNQNRGVIILVPEISLTPQMVRRIRSRFGSDAAVLHSRLTPAERYEQWQKILKEEVRVVVGARSAVFAPLAHIGLIVIDEEQESTYKSETHPRYHVRDIARLRARDHSAVLVLGSATPSVESYQRCLDGQSILLTLRERIGEAGLAKTEIVDMRQELAAGNHSLFSRALKKAMLDALSQGHQVILFINRRGFSGFVLCRQCGYIVRCRSCSVSMTIHLDPFAEPSAGPEKPTRLICHYCGRISPVPVRCPSCGSHKIGRFGAGTQQVEEAFNQEFSPYRALRMDQDTTIGKRAHARLLSRFEQGEAQVLIGTQMIAKGHDFKNVTVVGILAADLMLGLSDFRSSERTFQLITQAAGRAGRGAEQGTVVIQAYNIDDYAIRYAADQDYEGFFKQEIAYRRLMQYPPFGAICLMTVASLQEKEAQSCCSRLAASCHARIKQDPTFASIQLMGPSRAPIFRMRNRYRYRLVLKGPDQARLASFLTPVVDRIHLGKAALSIDFDPYSML